MIRRTFQFGLIAAVVAGVIAAKATEPRQELDTGPNAAMHVPALAGDPLTSTAALALTGNKSGDLGLTDGGVRSAFPRRRPDLARATPVPADGSDPAFEVMAGQMLMVGFQGDDVDQAGPLRVARQIEAGRLGGVIFFRQNVKSEAAVKRLTALFRRSAPPGLPVLIAVDQEGGKVQRLTTKVGFASTPSARRVADDGEEAATRIYGDLARALADWGFNVNLAPVVDLGADRDNPIIARLGRAFSGDPATVAALAGRFVAAHRAAGILTSLKHFPGHGSSDGDTHKGFVDVSLSWREIELAPFRTLIAEGLADMVMVAHVHLSPYGTEGQPASLSRDLIQGLLRDTLGFEGVVISDDMEMGAVTRLGDPIDLAAEAVAAGNDIIVYAGGAAGQDDIVDALQTSLAGAAAADPVLHGRVAQSFRRVMAMKADRLAPRPAR
ncbi:glycoside hydrolase family 3 protein [Acuticoccus yangtzensis]|uniref:glycoside hydrolase family 3 protein n=1 Tax=Acuticoccus yangtzensis TaxID=1443441 RepID=UPI0009F988F1|nr:glycoside hydrolase family 3 N-terminal domain-containing protein [Acuticoccus yangtzensis]